MEIHCRVEFSWITAIAEDFCNWKHLFSGVHSAELEIAQTIKHLKLLPSWLRVYVAAGSRENPS